MQISGAFCLILALALLLVPFPWVAAWIFAAAFHELCRDIAIRISASKGTRLRLYSYAAQMRLPQMSRGREALCALAGPLGSLALLALAQWLPRVAICAAMQAVYNLLPVYPLDGGRALRCCAAMLFPPCRADKICSFMQSLSLVCVFALAIYGCIWLRLGLFPLLLAVLLCIRLK